MILAKVQMYNPTSVSKAANDTSVCSLKKELAFYMIKH